MRWCYLLLLPVSSLTSLQSLSLTAHCAGTLDSPGEGSTTASLGFDLDEIMAFPGALVVARPADLVATGVAGWHSSGIHGGRVAGSAGVEAAEEVVAPPPLCLWGGSHRGVAHAGFGESLPRARTNRVSRRWLCSGGRRSRLCSGGHNQVPHALRQSDPGLLLRGLQPSDRSFGCID